MRFFTQRITVPVLYSTEYCTSKSAQRELPSLFFSLPSKIPDLGRPGLTIGREFLGLPPRTEQRAVHETFFCIGEGEGGLERKDDDLLRFLLWLPFF